MSATNDEIKGDELLSLINRSNTGQSKLNSLTALKDYILEQELDADVIIISLLQDISSKLGDLHSIKKEIKTTNKLLQKIYE